MNDTRTDEQKYQAWVDAVNICHAKMWKCVNGWIFLSPSGTKHDLSAADRTKLDEIEEKKLFLR